MGSGGETGDLKTELLELRRYLKSEGAEDAFDLLRDLAQRGEPVEAGLLDRLWHQRYR